MSRHASDKEKLAAMDAAIARMGELLERNDRLLVSLVRALERWLETAGYSEQRRLLVSSSGVRASTVSQRAAASLGGRKSRRTHITGRGLGLVKE